MSMKLFSAIDKLTSDIALKKAKQSKELAEAQEDRIAELEEIVLAFPQQIAALQNALNTLSQSYESHKHNYKDTTITDTEDGTGTTTTTIKYTTAKVFPPQQGVFDA